MHVVVLVFDCCLVALRSGGRYIYLWFTTIIHGLVVESVCYVNPDMDSFWHAQSMVMLLGRRLPLHIVFLCKFSSTTWLSVVRYLEHRIVCHF